MPDANKELQGKLGQATSQNFREDWLGDATDQWLNRVTHERNPKGEAADEAATWIWRLARRCWFDGANFELLDQVEAQLRPHVAKGPSNGQVDWLLTAHFAAAKAAFALTPTDQKPADFLKHLNRTAAAFFNALASGLGEETIELDHFQQRGSAATYLSSANDPERVISSTKTALVVWANEVRLLVNARCDRHTLDVAVAQTLRGMLWILGRDITQESHPRALHIPLENLENGTGSLAILNVWRFDLAANVGLPNVFFPDPVRIGLLAFGSDWLKAFQVAAEYADKRFPYLKTAAPYCWSVHFRYTQEVLSGLGWENQHWARPRMLTGLSASMAAAVLFRAALTDKQVNARAALTGGIGRDWADFHAAPIGGLAGKGVAVERLDTKGMQFFVGPCSDEERARLATIAQAFGSKPTYVDNCDQAYQLLTESESLSAVQQYLCDVVAKMGVVPAYFPNGATMPGIRVRVAVRSQPIRPDELLDRLEENERRDGLRDDAQAYAHPLSHDEAAEKGSGQGEKIEVLDWDGQAALRFPRCLILGDPGFGKSWLLKHTAYQIANEALARLAQTCDLDSLRLPLFIRLPDLASVLPSEGAANAKQITSAIERYLNASRVDERAVNEILRAVAAGRVELLLDAWDEVPRDLQGRLHACLADFLAQPSNTCVRITSRLCGRPPTFGNADGAKWEVQLLPFGDGQIADFVRGFFGAVRAAAADALLGALPTAPQLRGLAQTPLLLSFLCRYAYDRLPAGGAGPADLNLQTLERNNLYREIVQRFLDRTWHHGDDDFRPLDEDERQELLEILEPLAYKLLRAGKQQFTYREFTEALKSAGPDLSRDELASVRKRLVGRNGMIVPAGDGVDAPYLFLHLTIHEYLAARHLFELRDTVGYPLLATHWDHPDFNEAWKLFALEGRRTHSHVDRMIEIVTDERNIHPLDAHLFRHYAAALCWAGLADATHAPKFDAWKRVEEHVKSAFRSPHASVWEIMRALLSWRRPLPTPMRDKLLSFGNFYLGDSPLLEYVLSSQAHDPVVRRELLARLRDNKHNYWPWDVAEVLSSQAYDPDIRRELLELLRNDGRPKVRAAVLMALSSQAGNAEVRREMLARLRGDYRKGSILVKLVVLSKTDPLELRDCLSRNGEDGVWMAAVLALSTQAHDPDVRQELLAYIQDNEYGNERWTAVLALSLQVDNPEVRRELLARLRDDKDWNVRVAAMDALLSQAHDPEVRRELLERLRDEEFSGVHLAVVKALSSHAYDPEVRRELQTRIRYNKAWKVRVAAIEVLSSQAHDPTIRRELLARLRDDRDSRVRAAMVRALSSQAHDPEVRRKLLARLRYNSIDLREAAVDALSSEVHDPEIRRELLAQLRDVESSVVQLAVVRALSSSAHDGEVRRELLAQLQNDDLKYGNENADMRVAAVEALSSQAGAPDIRDVLLKRLQDESWFVRGAAMKALSSQAGAPEVRKALLELLQEENDDENVRYVAAKSLIDSIMRERHPR